MGSLDLLTSVGTPLTNKDFQTILIATQKSNQHKEKTETLEKLLTILWSHLDGSLNFDDQLLCSTCFYAVLKLFENKKETYSQILCVLKHSKLEGHNVVKVMSLIYGMFQSAFFASIPEQYDPVIDLIVIESLNILIIMGYEYSSFTFLTFKILGRLKKLFHSHLKKNVLDRNIQLQLLNLCNHNWENPFTGVRDMIRIIFRTILSATDSTTYNIILNDINGYVNEENIWCEGHYWNKAKYLMVTELIEDKATTELIIKQKCWIDGIIYSLRKPGLVSAGADMYFAILKKINDNEWRKIFMKPLLSALENESEKFVENFGNYWCLTTLKKLPELFDDLMSVNRNYCKYFILKQGNKIGLVKKDWLSDDPYPILIKNGLDSADLYIRLLSFDVLCLSYNTALPVDVECTLVFRFIENNINTDSTVLRINMIMSLKSFLNRLHGTFLCYHKSKDDRALEPSLKFCEKIQQIVIDSLNTPGNYQRKITSLKLCDVIFTHFSELPRKKHTWNKSTILITILTERKAWKFVSSDFVEKIIDLLKDSSDDIRDHVSNILLNHYVEYLNEKDVFNRLINSGLDSIKSKFFYEIYCGISIFKLLINLLLKEVRDDSQFNNVEDIFMFAFNNLQSIHNSGDNIVNTIESGTQLHPFVTIITIAIDYSLKYNYNLKSMKPTLIDDILNIMESQSMNFASDKDERNSDFCMIDGIIRDTIMESGYEEQNLKQSIKISDLSQIVLNSMWLNVKECCVLAAVLIKHLSQASQEERCRRCLNILANVLETSRHKGAMEAAGLALGQAIRQLTAQTEKQFSSLPQALLEVKLEELISRSVRTASVTRRGAGLSILVHQIVSSDSMTGKPLFHYFMRKMLTSCSSTSSLEPSSSQEISVRDLPRAIQIHFLTRVVTDRVLACEVMLFSETLSQIAFVNLTSPHWQIRNAALQLYGALIPKLIGQNKQSGTEDTTVATVAIDEFRTHFPELWRYILHRINADNSQDHVQAHSDLVAILNLLANCAKRYHFSFDITNDLTNPRVFNNLCKLLTSPICTVRNLTAKCICNNFSFIYIHNNLMKRDTLTANEFHGRLLVYELLHKNYSKIYGSDFEVLRLHYSNILNERRHSYMCKMVLENICDLSVSDDFEKAFLELNINRLSPGAHYWMDIRIEQCFNKTPLDSWPELIMKVLRSNVSARYLQVVRKGVELEDIGMETKIKICDLIFKYAIKCDLGVVWQFLYELSSNLHIAIPEFDIDYDKINHATRYALPIIVRSLIAGGRVHELVRVGIKIFQLSDFDSVDRDMRFTAMLANNELGIILPNKQLPDNATAKAIFCGVIFLEEEDEDIRYESINFYNNITALPLDINPYMCFKNILQINLLKNLFIDPKNGIIALCDEIDAFVKKYANKSQNCELDYNPFNIVKNNIYIELEYLQNFANNLRAELFEYRF